MDSFDDLLTRIEAFEAELDEVIDKSDDPKVIAKRSVELYAKLQGWKGRKDKLQAKMKNVDDRYTEFVQKLMVEGFGIPKEQPSPNPLHDVFEHHHGKFKHVHACSMQHNHLLRAICHRPECIDCETHDIHHGQDIRELYESVKDTPYG